MTTAVIRRLFEEIIREAEQRPEFGRRLADAIGGLSSKPSPTVPPKGTRRNRRTPGVLDPFEVGGTAELLISGEDGESLTFHSLGGWKPSPLGEAFRGLAVRFRGEHISEVIAHSLFAALPFRVHHEVPQAGAAG